MKKQTVESVVYVIDDDASVRNSLKSLFGSVGLHVELFESADDFLQIQHPDVACCLVLDVRLPGLSGLEFQSELANGGNGFAHNLHDWPWGYSNDRAGDEGGGR